MFRYSVSNVIIPKKSDLSLLKKGATLIIWYRMKKNEKPKVFFFDKYAKPILLDNQKVIATYQNILNDSLSYIIKKALQKLSTAGYVHIKEALSLQQFYSLAQSLGIIIHYQDVYINQKESRQFLQPEKLDYHTDAPETDIIGWYCIKQTAGGETSLISCKDFSVFFTKDEVSYLSEIKIDRPDDNQTRQVPLITKHQDYYRIYYHPWSKVSGFQTKNHKETFERFLNYLNDKEKNNSISILLQPGETLFIDNSCLMHGRGPLPTTCSRLLKRVWIAFDRSSFCLKKD